MRIAFDIQTLETYERSRGIGRYARSLLEGFAGRFPEHEIVCFGFLPEPLDDIAFPFSDNCSYRQYATPCDRERYLEAGFVAPLCWGDDFREFDVFFAPSPLMPDILLPDSAPCPQVALLLDAIPLVFRENGAEVFDEEGWRRYDRRLEALRSFDGYAAISEKTLADFADLASFPLGQSACVLAGITDEFTRPVGEEDHRRVVERYNLPKRYIITLTGFNIRKNWRGAIETLARLHANGHDDLRLVLVCSLLDEERVAMEAFSRQAGVGDAIILTDFVPDEDLPPLLAGADCLLFTSLYEGFGLPVLEAMACGAPVVSADNSSLPEVVGDTGILCPAEDVDALAAGVDRVLSDKAIAKDFARRAKERAATFTWTATAERLEALLQRVVRHEPLYPAPSTTRPPKTRVAFFSPLNPVRSGISDYSEELLEHLGDRFNIELFCDGFTPSNGTLAGRYPAWDISSFDRREAERPFDLNVYQMGNNAVHSRIYAYLRSRPGLTVLHDLYLLGFFQHQLAADQISGPEMTALLADESNGDNSLMTASRDTLLNLRMERHPCHRSIVEDSSAVLVHSDWARETLDGLGTTTAIHKVPHGLRLLDEASFDTPSRKAARRQLGVPDDAFVVAALGGLTPFKRLSRLIAAFEMVVEREPRAQLVFAGMGDRRYVRQLREEIAARRLSPYVTLLGYVSLPEFYRAASAADVCVNLRYPSLGETSGALLRTLSVGRPVLITDVNQYKEYPDEACWKISHGLTEEAEIAESLLALACRPDLCDAMGRAGRKLAESFRWETVAKSYAEVIEETAERRKAQSGGAR